MVKKILPLLIVFIFSIAAFGIDTDEAMPHYGPALSMVYFPGGAVTVPFVFLGANADDDLDFIDIFTPKVGSNTDKITYQIPSSYSFLIDNLGTVWLLFYSNCVFYVVPIKVMTPFEQEYKKEENAYVSMVRLEISSREESIMAISKEVPRRSGRAEIRENRICKKIHS